MYAIIRLKAARNAWYWAVHFRRRGALCYKRFYDQKHGGEKNALAVAIAWRDQQLAQTDIFTWREFHEQKRSNNTSGVPGVHFLRTTTQPNGIWQAKIKPTNGKMMTKTFSVLKFGNEEAFARAVTARREMLARLEDEPYLYHPTAKKFAVAFQGKGKVPLRSVDKRKKSIHRAPRAEAEGRARDEP